MSHNKPLKMCQDAVFAGQNLYFNLEHASPGSLVARNSLSLKLVISPVLFLFNVVHTTKRDSGPIG